MNPEGRGSGKYQGSTRKIVVKSIAIDDGVWFLPALGHFKIVKLERN